ncbi:MAG: hypothetical protein GXP19_07535, partial [Gammaproteobacteria bacterium]|nr:hypothetical protein [Gammaproteobacteria bacterium]
MAIDIGRLAVRVFETNLENHPEDQEDRNARAKYTIGGGILVGKDLVLICVPVTPLNISFMLLQRFFISADSQGKISHFPFLRLVSSLGQLYLFY